MIQHLGNGWVRFVFEAGTESDVYLVGDFNGWDEWSHRLTRQDDGTHQILVRLNPGEYEFKYKCGGAWFNDINAPKFAPNCWGSENSVVVVAGAGEVAGAHPPSASTQLSTGESPGTTLQPGA